VNWRIARFLAATSNTQQQPVNVDDTLAIARLRRTSHERGGL
jgi:hypothetical protein